MLNTFSRGAGPRRTLFLHGFLGSARNLNSLAQKVSELRPDLEIICADMPGHGVSPPMQAPYTLRALVEPVVELIESLGEVVIVGHSMGGRVAIEAAVARPALVEQVILLDIAPGPIGDRNKGLEAVAKGLLSAPPHVASRAEARAALVAGGLSPSLADWLLMNLSNDPKGGLSWRVDRQALVEFGAASRADDLWDHAEAVASKLRAAYGTKSGFVTEDDRTRLRALGVEPFPLDSDHYVHVDALEALSQWLAKTIHGVASH